MGKKRKEKQDNKDHKKKKEKNIELPPFGLAKEILDTFKQTKKKTLKQLVLQQSLLKNLDVQASFAAIPQTTAGWQSKQQLK